MALKIKLEGHLSANSLHESFTRIQSKLDGSDIPVNVIFDASNMAEYELNARATFVEWHKKNRANLNKIAIVTDKRLWHMVIHGMALASRTNMKPFSNEEAAQYWVSDDARKQAELPRQKIS